jgi:hypothetical protein
MATTHSGVSLMPADGTDSIVVLCAEDRLAAAVVRFWADEGQEAGSTPRESPRSEDGAKEPPAGRRVKHLEEHDESPPNEGY